MAGPAQIGRYRVERHLGSGGHATVWLARDEALDAFVAIKVLADNWSQSPEIRQRFVEEARILRLLDDERIVGVYDIAELEDGRPYFVMEYADRGSLLDRIQRRVASDEEFTVAEGLELSRTIADALAVAHERGVIHRDLKPSNVLFRGPGVGVPAGPSGRRGQERLMLADFGIARRLESSSGRTLTGGTPRYMAPEQAERGAGADPRSDIYSAAMILYELLAGDVPSVAERTAADSGRLPGLRRWRPDVPATLEVGLARALATDPAGRWPTATSWLEFIAGVDPLAEAAADELGPPDMPELIRRFCDESRRRLSAGPVRDSLELVGERVVGPLRIAVVGGDPGPDGPPEGVSSESGVALDAWPGIIRPEPGIDDPDGFVVLTSGDFEDPAILYALRRHGSIGEANTIVAASGVAISSAVNVLEARSTLLRAASAMRAIDGALRADTSLPGSARDRLEDAFESLTTVVPAIAQATVLGDALGGRLRLTPDQVVEVERVLAGTGPEGRLGAPEGANLVELSDLARTGASRWRSLTTDSRATLATRSAAEVIAAAYESMAWELERFNNP